MQTSVMCFEPTHCLNEVWFLFLRILSSCRTLAQKPTMDARNATVSIITTHVWVIIFSIMCCIVVPHPVCLADYAVPVSTSKNGKNLSRYPAG
jgi:hypothetical protein